MDPPKIDHSACDGELDTPTFCSVPIIQSKSPDAWKVPIIANTTMLRPIRGNMFASPSAMKPEAPFSSPAEMISFHRKFCDASPTMTPEITPTVTARKISRFLIATNINKKIGTSMNNVVGSPESAAPELPDSERVTVTPTIAKAITAIAAAVNEYLARVATTAPTSAVPVLVRYACVEAETIVESEIGAILSPNKQPDNIAPASNAGCAPKAIPAGKKTGNEVNRVPSDVAVAAAMIQTRINVTGTKKAAPTPSSFASQMKPDDSSVTSNS